MADGVLAREGYAILLRAMLADLSPWCHLYTNDPPLRDDRVAADFAEPVYDGYAPVALAGFTPPTLKDGVAYSQFFPASFLWAGPPAPAPIRGYYVTDGPTGNLLWFWRRPGAAYALGPDNPVLTVTATVRLPCALQPSDVSGGVGLGGSWASSHSGGSGVSGGVGLGGSWASSHSGGSGVSGGVGLGGSWASGPVARPAVTDTVSVAATSTNTVTFTLPGGLAVGDILIGLVWKNGGGVLTSNPVGWTAITAHITAPMPQIKAYYRVVDGSEGPTAAFGSTGSAAPMGGLLLVVSGATVPPALMTAQGGTSATAACTGLTLTAGDGLVLYCLWTDATPIPIASASDYFLEGTMDATDDLTAWSDSLYPSGATGTVSFGLGASRTWWNVMIAMYP